MVRREILEHPLETVEKFDWFNDYHDTLSWLGRGTTSKEAVIYNWFKLTYFLRQAVKTPMDENDYEEALTYRDS